MSGAPRVICLVGVLISALLLQPAANAEPYIAVKKDLRCSTCHVSPSGGGMRTAYGNIYAQTEFVAHALGSHKPWTGEIGRYLAVGGDARWGWERQDVPGQPADESTGLEEFLAYVQIKPFPKYFSLYFDAKLRPEDPVIREQYAKLTLPGGKWWLRAGEFFLPYGFRLQDDEAFIRQVSGINYNTPDTGWEAGYESGRWSAQLAVTRGTAGGPEVDAGKQYSARVSFVRQDWRIGGSFNFNDAKAGDRQMQNVFAGINTGSIAWLAELDYIIDDGSPTGRRELWASLVEANWGYRQGQNLKLTFEWFDPDDDVDEDERNRASLIWEYAPVQFVQGRLGYRRYGGIPQNGAQNREQFFAELHLWF